MRNSPPNVLDVCIGSPAMRGPKIFGSRHPFDLPFRHVHPTGPCWDTTEASSAAGSAAPRTGGADPNRFAGGVGGKGGFIETSADLSQKHSLPNVLEGCILTQLLTSFLCYQHACWRLETLQTYTVISWDPGLSWSKMQSGSPLLERHPLKKPHSKKAQQAPLYFPGTIWYLSIRNQSKWVI